MKEQRRLDNISRMVIVSNVYKIDRFQEDRVFKVARSKLVRK